MPNYISLNFNHTPLDFHQLEEKYHDGKKIELKDPKTPSNFHNIFLIVGIVAFVLSLSYTVTVDQLSSRSRASEKAPEPTPQVIHIQTATSVLKDYPKQYKAEVIPQELYDSIKKTYSQDTPGRKNYVIDKVARYYIYKDVLEQNDLTFEESTKTDPLQKLVDDVNTMQTVIQEKILTQPDSTYKDLDSIVTNNISQFK